MATVGGGLGVMLSVMQCGDGTEGVGVMLSIVQ